MSTISGTSSTSTSVSSAQSAAQTASAAAQQALLEAGQSLISGSTGNTSIDPQTMVTALVNAKVAGQQASLQIEAANDNLQISNIGQLSASLAMLQGALTPLQNGSLMSAFTATTSGSGITATAGSGASASSYSVYVGQIAQTQSITSAPISVANTAAMGTGTMTLSVGSQSMTINIGSSNNSLSQIVSAINSSTSNPGISASIVTGSDGSHLVLSSTLTGEANTINVSVNADSSTSALAKLGGVQTIQGGTYASAGIASATTASGDGSTLTISAGSSSFTVTPAAGDTLANIASEINTAGAGLNVTASVVTDSSGQQHLVVAQQGANSSSPVKVTANASSSGSTDSTLTAIATALPASTAAPTTGTAVGASSIISLSGAGWSQTTAAQSAQLTINGTQVTSALNTVNALSGATLSLSSAAVGTNQTLTIAQDTTTMASEISSFVSDYNTVISTIASLTKFDSSNPTGSGTMLGDSMINAITSSFGTIIGSRVKGSGVTATLADLGITLNSDGTLSLNSTTLNNALQNNSSKVAAIFNSTNGIAEQLNAKLKTFTQDNGVIAQRETALSNDLNSVTKQTTQLQTYIAQLTSMYQSQFTMLNDIMSKTNNETEYLTQLFGGANNTGTLNKSS
ncbi:flagellar filament capping protein FliD [Paraburkholderia adhaesiva]|uniref:flagellar filament capping protein FliD n=1 Tax=Paraburkholderia adhaesiva TaxID=2883244 RepID=UPI001F3BF1D8|nr:flagellar filament capping protein FliD [Paraburkholderia adhaesiva]